MELSLDPERVGALFAPGLAAVASLAVAMILGVRPPRDRALRLLIPLAFCVFLWNLGTLLVFAAKDEASALLAAQWVYYPSVVVLPAIAYQVISRFTRRELSRRDLLLLWLPTLAFLVTVFGGWYVRDFHRYWFGFYADGRTLPHLAWTAWYGLLGGLVSLDLLRAFRRERDPYRRNQILFTSAALAFMFLGGSTNLVPLFGIPLYPVGNLTSILFVGTQFWILTRYRLIDFPAFLGGATLSGLLFLVAASLDVSILAVARRLLAGAGTAEPTATAIAATLAALAAVFVFLAGQRWLSGPLRRWVFAGRQEAALQLLEEVRSLGGILDPAEIRSRLQTTLHEAAGALSGAIVRYDETTARVRVEGAFGPVGASLEGQVIPLSPGATLWLLGRNAGVWAVELAAPREDLADVDRASLATLLDRTAGVLLFPFAVQGRFRGGLVLGPRAGGTVYPAEEIRPLRLLAQQAAVALENARLYSRLAESNESLRRASDELAELNRSLERKVAARTAELEEANVKIQAADRLKSQFLANMSHELRTPLNSIIGFAEILVEKAAPKLEPRHQKFLGNILGSGQHLLGLINDLLDLSKIEAGRMEILPEPFDPRTLLEGVVAIIRGVADRAGVQVVLDSPPDLPPLESDPVKFKQVAYNLASNAVKFSPSGSVVTMRLRVLRGAESPLECDAIALAVIDRGIGISAEDQTIIFDEFRQAEGGSTRRFGGTGLGLALVRRFLEMQGGRIDVESTPGVGSTFTATLPMVAVPAPGTSLAGDEAPAAPAVREADRTVLPDDERAGTILVVEDDPEAYRALASELEAANYRVVRARHGDEAIRMIGESRPDLVVLDLVLPGLDGWEVLKQVKSTAETRDLPVVIVTMIENRELGLALGADDFFVKPVPRDALLGRVRELAPRGHGAAGVVLLVDDDPAVHELVGEDLSAAGYRLRSAFGGQEGIEAARREPPDVVLLDLMMPGTSGFDVAEALRGDPATAAIPIVVLTARDLSATDRAQLGDKIQALFRKGSPSRGALVQAIREITRKRGKETPRAR